MNSPEVSAVTRTGSILSGEKMEPVLHPLPVKVEGWAETCFTKVADYSPQSSCMVGVMETGLAKLPSTKS